MKKIFQNLYKPNEYIPYVDLVTFLDHNQEILKINEIKNP